MGSIIPYEDTIWIIIQASPWARSVLSRLGRLLWMEDAEGSPKAAVGFCWLVQLVRGLF